MMLRDVIEMCISQLCLRYISNHGYSTKDASFCVDARPLLAAPYVTNIVFYQTI